MTQHPYDDIEIFALGALDGEAASAVLDHADRCHSCAVLLADAMSAAAALGEPLEERPMTHPLRGLSNSKVRAAGNPPTLPAAWRGVAPWLVSAAAIAAALFIGMWNVTLRGQQQSLPIAALVHSHFIHHALSGSAGVGSAKVLQSVDGRWLYAVGDGFAPSSAVSVWERRGVALTRVGDATTDGAGRFAAYFEQTPGAVDALLVVPAGADPSADKRTLHWP